MAVQLCERTKFILGYLFIYLVIHVTLDTPL